MLSVFVTDVVRLRRRKSLTGFLEVVLVLLGFDLTAELLAYSVPVIESFF